MFSKLRKNCMMTYPIMSIGILIFAGYLLGVRVLPKNINLPQISGYIGAGILLNPAFIGPVLSRFSLKPAGEIN